MKMISLLDKGRVAFCLLLSVNLPAVAGCKVADGPHFAGQQKGSIVKMRQSSGRFHLFVNGSEFPVKGAGGDADQDLLTHLGGNCVRTWGADNLDQVLNDAQKRGLMVVAGIWLQHREYFDYHDSAKVQAQLEECRKIVRQYRNHPALLMWAFGNEAEGDGKDPETFVAINNIAEMSHQEDPNHPAMTVMAEIGDGKLESIEKYCPAIDIIGINSYGGGPTLAKRFSDLHPSKPYILTEFGPNGPWEVGKTGWGAALEPTSTEKAQAYENTYRSNVIDNSAWCLGSFTFLWGHKVEGTPTWFGMFLPDGSRTAAVDSIGRFWSGKEPEHPCPTISNLRLTNSEKLVPGSSVGVDVDAKGSDGKPCRITWSLLRELASSSEDPSREFDPEKAPIGVKANGNHATLQLPMEGGAYRIYATAHDAYGGAATANLPIYIKAPRAAHAGVKATLPVTVYDEAATPGPYVPTGWMGNVSSMHLDMNCTEGPHSGQTCILFSYLSNGGWGGIAWQCPANDWGDKPGSVNLTGAKKLTFWLKGSVGGEKVKVEFGILGKDKPYPDSDHGVLDSLVLTNEWKQYSIDVGDFDMGQIKTGFVFVVGGQGHPITVYIDDVRYE
jgi:hypothetical protein